MTLLKYALLLVVVVTFSSCGIYAMPTEDDFQKNPTTNNPRIVGNKGKNDLTPGVSY
jgi:hypothetical protein